MDLQDTIHEKGYKAYNACGRIYIIASLITASFIIRKDFQNRRILRKNGDVLNPSLLYISAAVFVISILYGISVVGVWSPWGCIPMFRIGWILNGFQNDILGFFQIRRMELCLAQHRIHSTFGYPNWLFKTLYAICIVHAMYIILVFTVWTEGIQLIEVVAFGTFWGFV